jgi:predicted AAA+ superfamily ATPase
LLNVYLDFIEDSGTKDRIYIFIDEVTFVNNWERAIKYLADLGKLKN